MKIILFTLILLAEIRIVPAQTIKYISESICDSINKIESTSSEEMLAAQRSIYRDEMVKYPTLIVDITDLNKPHQYNEFNYKINRQLLKSCPKYEDQFSLLPLSKILDVEGLFIKNQYDSLEREIIEFIYFNKIDLVVVSIDDVYPYNDIYNFGTGHLESWKTGKRYELGGILIAFSKTLNQVSITLSEKTISVISKNDCNKIIQEIILPNFEKGDYFKGIMDCIRALKDKV